MPLICERSNIECGLCGHRRCWPVPRWKTHSMCCDGRTSLHEITQMEAVKGSDEGGFWGSTSVLFDILTEKRDERISRIDERERERGAGGGGGGNT